MDTTYKTSDLYLASYLTAIGCEFVKCERLSGQARKCIFVFDVSFSDKEALIAGWINGSGQVSGKRFAEAIASLKSLVNNTP
jgi:hypothetical protein